MGIRDKPTAPASPWQNGFAERLIGSIRRECVDHFLVLGEAHLRRILRAYAGYYNDIRTHWSLDKDAPVSRPVQRTGSLLHTRSLADFITTTSGFRFSVHTVGGLLPLLVFIGPRAFGSEPSLFECFQKLRRFSTLAAWSVTVLAASGALNTWFMTNGLESFFGTQYGNLVLIKIALFVVMLGFGTTNRFWLTPRLLATKVPAANNTKALRLLCASISLEIALGFIVICVVAVLGQLPPPGHMHHPG